MIFINLLECVRDYFAGLIICFLNKGLISVECFRFVREGVWGRTKAGFLLGGRLWGGLYKGVL